MKQMNKLWINLALKARIVSAICIFSMFSFSANAQFMQDACLPDCPNEKFIGPFSIVLEICPGHFFNVEYGYRNACNIWYDYYIGDEITPAGGTSSTDFYNCINSVGGMNEFIRLVSEQLIIANPAAFPPTNPGGCETHWRVLKGSCWRGDIVLGVGEQPQSGPYTSGPNYIDIIWPCTTSDCCLERFTVCMGQDSTLNITNTGYLPPEFPDCNGQNDPWSIGTIFECIPVCGSIYNR